MYLKKLDKLNRPWQDDKSRLLRKPKTSGNKLFLPQSILKWNFPCEHLSLIPGDLTMISLMATIKWTVALAARGSTVPRFICPWQLYNALYKELCNIFIQQHHHPTHTHPSPHRHKSLEGICTGSSSGKNGRMRIYTQRFPFFINFARWLLGEYQEVGSTNAALVDGLVYLQ